MKFILVALLIGLSSLCRAQSPENISGDKSIFQALTDEFLSLAESRTKESFQRYSLLNRARNAFLSEPRAEENFPSCIQIRNDFATASALYEKAAQLQMRFQDNETQALKSNEAKTTAWRIKTQKIDQWAECVVEVSKNKIAAMTASQQGLFEEELMQIILSLSKIK